MNSFKIGLLATFQFVLISFPIISNAAITLPWSTSFGSTPIEIIRYEGVGYSCNNCIDGLGVIEDHVYNAHIDAISNRPGGSGSMGYRCEIADGTNAAQSHSLGAYLTSPQPEIWFRFYVKYPTGFKWGSLLYHKWVYLGTPGTMNSVVVEPGGSGVLRFYTYSGGGSYPSSPARTLQEFWGGGTLISDGSWHCVEFHLKMDTTSSPYNGIGQMWVDGTLVINRTDVNWSNGNSVNRQGWNMWRLNTNQSSPSNAGGIGNPSYVAYDDIAISNTGYIGPLGGGSGGDTTPPAISNGSPSGTLAYGTTSTNLTVTTNENAICKYGTSDVAYASLPSTFTTTGSTAHSQALTNLTNGSSYTYYVRCMDGSGNSNSASTGISFNVSSTSSSSANLLFSEDFENASFTARGWYDPNGGAISNTVYQNGSGSFYCAFAASGTKCSGGTPTRHLFTPSDGVYVSFWMRLSSNWRGSQRNYHPHIFYLMTDADATDYQGPYGSATTAYIEVLSSIGSPYATYPQIGLQDGAHINSSYIGSNLCSTNENRAAHGCNGLCDSNTWEVQDCYNGPPWLNGRMTRSPNSVSFNEWHHYEAYFKMNSISGNVGQRDGIMKMWVDGVLVKSYTDLIYRTNQHATMKWNKLIISPYIGDGSPIAQELWIDNLYVYDDMPFGTSTPPSTTLSIESVIN